MKPAIVFLLMFYSLVASAADLPYKLQVQNPERDIAYVVGDKIKRTVNLEVKKPYTLTLKSLPAEGLRRNGIELREIRVEQRETVEVKQYHLEFDYQVFTRSDVVSKFELPREVLHLGTDGKSLNLLIPAWQFQVSPLATYSRGDIEKDMSPYRPPLTVDSPVLEYLLAGFLLLMLAGVGGLVYLHADEAWFPGMGGPFAASYRKIANLDDSSEGLRAAATSIHIALNQTLGENVFSQNLEQLFQQKPAFKTLEAEISSFFALSNHLLYGMTLSEPVAARISDLLAFCKSCRDCERALA